MNKVILIGRIANNLEIRSTEKGTSVLQFNLAINRDKEKADFPMCISFGKSAELINEYCQKGDKLAVEGSIQTDNYTNKEGRKVYSTSVLVNKIEFIEMRKENKKEEDNPFKKFAEEHQEEMKFTDEEGYDLPF